MLVVLRCPPWLPKRGGVTKGKRRIYPEGRFWVRAGLRPGPGEASGGPPESFWDLRSGRKVIKIYGFGVFSKKNRIRLTLNRPGRRAFRETTREGAAILEGTVQDSLFSHEDIEKSCRFVVDSGITKGVLFGFR